MRIHAILLTTVLTIFSFCQINGQNQMPVYAVTSTVIPQAGSEVGYTIDGSDNTLYHSSWSGGGLPDTLDFYFLADVPSINQIEYTPRTSGSNGIWTSLDVYYSTQAAPNTFIKVNPSTISWSANNSKKTINLPSAIIQPHIIRFAVKTAATDATGNGYSSCAEMRFFSSQNINKLSVCDIPSTEFSTVSDDKMLKISSGTASSYQSGSNIDKSFDGDTTTIYHSNWGGGGFPISLIYTLQDVSDVDYLTYIPRMSGNNGYWGNVSISYSTSTSDNTFTNIMNYNFGQKGFITHVYFPSTAKNVKRIKITVQDGLGGFASCAEMQFFKQKAYPASNDPYLTIFTDNLYASLLPSTTQANIDTISSPFYKALAQCIYNGKYASLNRLKSYPAYPNITTVASALKNGTYDPYENPTGIQFIANRKAVLFVQNIPSTEIVYLRVADFSKEGSAFTTNSYQLKNGINVLNITNGGLGYISYYSDNVAIPNVSINIPTGNINGVFDLQTSTNIDWINFLSNSTYPKLDILGISVHLVYDKAPLKFNTPLDGLSFIRMYDSIIRYEQVMMGLYKYNKKTRNHMIAYTESSGGWYAGDLVHFDLTWGAPNATSISGLDFWGVAHEFGHVNQIRPGIKWTGTTEVSNNIYSSWVSYQMNRKNNRYTRLESENVAASINSPAIAGGRMNSAIDSTVISGKNMNELVDPFMKLVPFWQLELYYQLAGASRNAPVLSLDTTATGNTSAIDYAHWFGIVGEKVRNTNETNMTNGQLVLNFVKNTCDAVQEDLTDFFTKTGFLIPINKTIDDYAPANITITQTDINNAIAYIKGKNYPLPISPVIQYISAHSVNAFAHQLPVSGHTGVSVTLNSPSSGKNLLIQHSEWKNVVAFETYHYDSLMNVTIAGTGDPSNQTTTVQYPALATNVYAIGYDGNKILVYPVENTLPVTFTTIHAKSISRVPSKILVNWNISFEQGILSYEIEKSNDAKSFTKVGTVQASNNTAYQYTDTDENISANGSGLLFYRIKAIGSLQENQYSNIASANLQATTATIRTHPNPFSDKISIQHTGEYNIVQAKLINTAGIVVISQKINSNSNQFDISTGGLANGNYMLLLIDPKGKTVESKKIFKAK